MSDTPKQRYEMRKAERNKLKDMDYQVCQRTEQLMMLDMLDRFVTAAERIADALEPKPCQPGLIPDERVEGPRPAKEPKP